MGDVTIVRALREADRPDWDRMWAGYNAFYERVIPAETTELTWSRFFDGNEPVHALIAEQDGTPVGLVHYLFHRSTSMIELTCYLQDLYVDDGARRRGIGRALIEAVYERAHAAGSRRVYWQTHETNTSAMKLYDQLAERSGFLVYRHSV